MIFSQEHGIHFADEIHRDFYEQYLWGQKADCYTKALVYTLGINPDTRRNMSRLYDVEGKRIVPGAIHEGWQTSGSAQVTRLAFNLFTDRPATAYNDTDSPDFDECKRYSVSDIFCCGYAQLFVEAIKLRYPEYMGVQ